MRCAMSVLIVAQLISLMRFFLASAQLTGVWFGLIFRAGRHFQPILVTHSVSM